MPVDQVRQARWRLAAAGVGMAAAVSVAACGGSSSPSPSPSASSVSPGGGATGSPMPTAGAAATAAVRSAWMEFFDARTAMARRVALLQNGHEFASVLATQARMPMAQSASAEVTRVTMVSPGQARVTYTVLVGGSPVLTDQTGVAVYQDGIWKVDMASFCGLLAMQNGGKRSGLPAACHSGG